MASKPGAISAAALDTDPADRSELAQPARQRAVARAGRRERGDTEDTAVFVAPDDGRRRDVAGDERTPTTATLSARSDTTAERATTVSPTTKLEPTIIVLAVPAGASQADTCAALDARKQGIDAAEQQVNETYRDDRVPRDRLKAEFDAEGQAIDTLKESLGC